MAQDYVWKVSYSYHLGVLRGWKAHGKVFTNKVEALKFMSLMENNRDAKNVKLIKWRG